MMRGQHLEAPLTRPIVGDAVRARVVPLRPVGRVEQVVRRAPHRHRLAGLLRAMPALVMTTAWVVEVVSLLE
jgi:hypothetical protein